MAIINLFLPFFTSILIIQSKALSNGGPTAVSGSLTSTLPDIRIGNQTFSIQRVNSTKLVIGTERTVLAGGPIQTVGTVPVVLDSSLDLIVGTSTALTGSVVSTTQSDSSSPSPPSSSVSSSKEPLGGSLTYSILNSSSTGVPGSLLSSGVVNFGLSGFLPSSGVPSFSTPSTLPLTTTVPNSSVSSAFTSGTPSIIPNASAVSPDISSSTSSGVDGSSTVTNSSISNTVLPGSSSMISNSSSTTSDISSSSSSTTNGLSFSDPSTTTNGILPAASGVSVASNGSYVIGNTTLIAGGIPYISGTETVSLGLNSILYIDGTTTQIPTPTSTLSSNSSANSAALIALVTSTLTEAPSDFSTQAVTNTDWISNTWLTTIGNDHQPTIVPVLVGCPNCGGIHGGILLWNLPKFPSVSFRFPQFPQLPSFHLPCIKLFGVQLSGDCDSPPTNDSEGSSNPGQDVPQPQPVQPPTQPQPLEPQPSQPEPIQSEPTQSLSSQDSSTSSSSTTSSSCSSTSTVTDVRVFCSVVSEVRPSQRRFMPRSNRPRQVETTQEPGSASITCYSTTTYSTATGCSVTGTTATVISSTSNNPCRPTGFDEASPPNPVITDISSSCSAVCPTASAYPTTGYWRDPNDWLDPEDLDTLSGLKRDLAGRIEYRALEKRAPESTVRALGSDGLSCVLQTASFPAVTRPAFPGAYTDIFQPESRGSLPASSSVIPRYYTTTDAPGCIPTLVKMDINEYSNTIDRDDRPSTDHAYEVGILKAFFNSIIHPGGNFPTNFNCNTLTRIFFPTQGSQPGNRMSLVFDSLANAKNPEFVIMSTRLNGDAKGIIFDPPRFARICKNQINTPVTAQMGFLDAYSIVLRKLVVLQGIAMGRAMVHADGVIDLMQKTNNRIFTSFQIIDGLAACDGDPNVPDDFSLADRYRAFMNKFVDDQKQTSAACASNLFTSILNDFHVMFNLPDIVLNDYQSLVARYQGLQQYGDPRTSPNWYYDINWEFNVLNQKIKRSLDERAPACSLTRLSQSSSGSSTATPSSSNSSFPIQTQTSGSIASTYSSNSSFPIQTQTSSSIASTLSSNSSLPIETQSSSSITTSSTFSNSSLTQPPTESPTEPPSDSPNSNQTSSTEASIPISSSTSSATTPNSSEIINPFTGPIVDTIPIANPDPEPITPVNNPEPSPMNINQGILNCKAVHREGDPLYYFTREAAITAITDYCNSDGNTSLGGASMPTIEKDESDGNGGTIVLSVVADVTDANCPGFDANTETTTEDCQDRLMTIVDDCDTKKGSSDLWKQGGIFYRDCLHWSISRKKPAA